MSDRMPDNISENTSNNMSDRLSEIERHLVRIHPSKKVSAMTVDKHGAFWIIGILSLQSHNRVLRNVASSNSQKDEPPMV